VVKRIEDESGNIVSEISPVLEKETVSKEVSNQLKGYLRQVVSDGTGKTAGVYGYDIGGKTGTAQKLPRGEGNYLVSFVGYVPQENPQVLIYCVVDTPNTADQAHSSYAQEIVHNVLVQILPYLNVPTVQEPEGSKAVSGVIPYQ
jgi:stage V sporulation protein D (sporulation-specific penicillin-binding protein)